tara:strand:+ start:2304 stop:2414 length:111 start_codon:yes stop_codon:yes gene_type:complete
MAYAPDVDPLNVVREIEKDVDASVYVFEAIEVLVQG